MSTPRYYIVDLADGFVKSTNDAVIANDLSESDDFFVIDTQDNTWITTTGAQSIPDWND